MNRSTRKVVRDYTLTFVAALGVAFCVRHFLVETFRVPSSTMKPTLISGDTVFVNKWPYSHFFLQKQVVPQRGDVVVFFTTDKEDSRRQYNFIRRVIGLPKDKISLEKGLVILNGKKIASSESLFQVCSQEKISDKKSYSVCRKAPMMADVPTFQVPENSVFVLSDQRTSRPQMHDSVIPIASIRGEALYIFLSVEPLKHELKNSDLSSERKNPWLPHIRFDRIFKRID